MTTTPRPAPRLDPGLLTQVGEQLFGADWQRPLARALGPHHPGGARDRIDDRLVRRWAAGERPVADWVPAVLGELLVLQSRASVALAQRLWR